MPGASCALRSPFAESTLCGREKDRNVPRMKTANAPYSGQRGPSPLQPRTQRRRHARGQQPGERDP